MTPHEGERSPYPPILFHGADMDARPLSGAQWSDLETSCGVRLSPHVRKLIDDQIRWCQWEKGNAQEIPRMSAVKRRLRAFVRGIDMALGAMGYLAAARIKSVGDRPPIDLNMLDHPDGKHWRMLMSAARASDWKDGHLTSRAVNRGGATDDPLMMLHALGYTASRAIAGWDSDKGGKVGGGDRHFTFRLIEILHEAGIDVAYSQDRTADAGHEMNGPGWSVLRHLWSIRTDAFTTNEHSTLGNLYRAALKRFKERTALK